MDPVRARRSILLLQTFAIEGAASREGIKWTRDTSACCSLQLPYVFRPSATLTAPVVTDGTAAHRIAEHTNAVIQDTAPNVPTTNIARPENPRPLNENLRKLRGLRSNRVHHQAVEIPKAGTNAGTAGQIRA